MEEQDLLQWLKPFEETTDSRSLQKGIRPQYKLKVTTDVNLENLE